MQLSSKQKTAAVRGGSLDNSYRKALRQLRGTLIAVGALSAGVNVLMLTGPMFMLQVYDRVLSSGSVPTLIGLYLVVVLCFVFLGLYDFFRVRFLSRAGYKLDALLGEDGFKLWIGAAGQGYPANSRPLNDLSAIRGFLASPGMLGFFDLPWVPFFLLVTFLIHPWLGALTLAGALVVTCLALAGQALTYRSYREAMGMDGAESFFVEQGHRNAETLRALGMEGPVAAHWREMHDAGLSRGQQGGDRSEMIAAASKAFRMLLQSSLLGLGGYLALHQEISAGMIVAASIIAGRALAPIDQVIGQWRSVVRAREAHGRLMGAMEGCGAAPRAIDLPAPEGRLVLRGVCKFAPGQAAQADRPPILAQVSFAIGPGDALGVIGPSASGKSTLARLIAGVWKPDAGELRLDGATLDQWAPDALGRHVGYLPQHLELLAGTVRDNIARFDAQATDEAVIAAAKLAGVHEMILSLPAGYGTKIGFGAPPLSGGQIQRIGLARALYGKPQLIVLDEPNSNLDAAGDEALAIAIGALREAGRTVIVMAHRPSAIGAANKILVLQSGTVAHFGDKEEVLAKAMRPAQARSASNG
ncbi:type I secretion system permease/ATPase [Thioclava sp. DLFJ5-1]|uniref:type I secretion system permease/ATPase n=1 Tax=Thioclava sp. DLFJ5-1 TaxID=1915314 RepID=UPI000998DEB7|nr:type I secretion system permease/ATPase [Thioclava sp. DLFJ5-1]